MVGRDDAPFQVFHNTKGFNFPIERGNSREERERPGRFFVTDDLVLALELRRLPAFKCTTLKTETQGSYCLDGMPDSWLFRIHRVQRKGRANVIVRMRGASLDGIFTSTPTSTPSNGKAARLTGSSRQEGDVQSLTYTIPLNQVMELQAEAWKETTAGSKVTLVTLHQISLPEVERAKEAWRNSKLGILLLRHKLPHIIVEMIDNAVYFRTM